MSIPQSTDPTALTDLAALLTADEPDLKRTGTLDLRWVRGSKYTDVSKLSAWLTSISMDSERHGFGRVAYARVDRQRRHEIASKVADIERRSALVEQTLDALYDNLITVGDDGLPTVSEATADEGILTRSPTTVSRPGALIPKELCKLFDDLKYKETIGNIRKKMAAYKAEHEKGKDGISLSRYHKKITKYHLRINALEKRMLEAMRETRARMDKKNGVYTYTVEVLSSEHAGILSERLQLADVSALSVQVTLSLREKTSYFDSDSVDDAMKWENLDRTIADARLSSSVMARHRGAINTALVALGDAETAYLEAMEQAQDPDMPLEEQIVAEAMADEALGEARKAAEDAVQEALSGALLTAEETVIGLLRDAYEIGRLSRLRKRKRLISAGQGLITAAAASGRLVLTSGTDVSAYYSLLKLIVGTVQDINDARMSLEETRAQVIGSIDDLEALLSARDGDLREVRRKIRWSEVGSALISSLTGSNRALESTTSHHQKQLELYAHKVEAKRVRVAKGLKRLGIQIDKWTAALQGMSALTAEMSGPERAEAVDFMKTWQKQRKLAEEKKAVLAAQIPQVVELHMETVSEYRRVLTDLREVLDEASKAWDLITALLEDDPDKAITPGTLVKDPGGLTYTAYSLDLLRRNRASLTEKLDKAVFDGKVFDFFASLASSIS